VIKYYEAEIILSDGSIRGGYVGDTAKEAYDRAKDVVNTDKADGELFPGAVRIRVTKCEFVCERTAQPKAEEWVEVKRCRGCGLPITICICQRADK